MTDATDRPWLEVRREAQRDAALARVIEQDKEFRRIAELVIPSDCRPTSKRVTDVIKLGDDYLVEVADRDSDMWTFIVGGKCVHWYHDTQEQAILHLIAFRYDPDPDTNIHAAYYAGRVLGIPDTNE